MYLKKKKKSISIGWSVSVHQLCLISYHRNSKVISPARIVYLYNSVLAQLDLRNLTRNVLSGNIFLSEQDQSSNRILTMLPSTVSSHFISICNLYELHRMSSELWQVIHIFSLKIRHCDVVVKTANHYKCMSSDNAKSVDSPRLTCREDRFQS